ncbi:MAG TPA: hypothetical protein VE779_05975, partial [Candidatus Angelobacter sp.]|nr:hypothetical protein [Candidatus Angelobacter sp.]
PDLNPREQFAIVVMSILMIWLGVHTTFFTRRFEASCQTILQEATPSYMGEATVPLRLQSANQDLLH